MKKLFLWVYALFMLFAPILCLILCLIHFSGNMDWAQWSLLLSLILMGIITSAFIFTHLYNQYNESKIFDDNGNYIGAFKKIWEKEANDNIKSTNLGDEDLD